MLALYTDTVDRLDRADWLLPTLARVVFALVFLVYFKSLLKLVLVFI